MLYAYSVKKPIGELNLERALDEDMYYRGRYRSLFFLYNMYNTYTYNICTIGLYKLHVYNYNNNINI